MKKSIVLASDYQKLLFIQLRIIPSLPSLVRLLNKIESMFCTARGDKKFMTKAENLQKVSKMFDLLDDDLCIDPNQKFDLVDDDLCIDPKQNDNDNDNDEDDGLSEVSLSDGEDAKEDQKDKDEIKYTKEVNTKKLSKKFLIVDKKTEN